MGGKLSPIIIVVLLVLVIVIAIVVYGVVTGTGGFTNNSNSNTQQSENTFVEIHAMNIFSKSYSEIKKDADGTSQDSEKAENYTLNTSRIKSTMKSYANTLVNHVEKNGDVITMENGTQLHPAGENRQKELIMYLPEEAVANSEMKKELENIAKQVQSETGVKVVYQYKDKVFTEAEKEKE